jgi:succinoglycan biosynthesis transport protein ExoP
MRMQVSSAERAVVDFKRTHNIVQSLNGQLLNEQQVSEVNTQLILARAAKAEAKAKLNRIQQVMKQDVPDASVTDALHSEVIIKLRNQYLEFAAKERVFAERYGPNHLATLNLRTQMLELRHNIEDEMKKIAESYKSDYEIADTREQNLTTSLAGAVSDSQSTNQAQIQLRELDSNAQSARTVYDSFLQRYMESVQQQSFPISEARMISTAIVPLSKSSPNLVLTLAATTMAGGLLGFGIALFREFSDRVFRTPAQIEDVLGANCIATLPALKLANPAMANAPVSVSHPDKKAAPPRTLTANGLLRYVVEAPFSQYTEGLRALKVVVDLNGVLKSNKVVGMTSTLPNEGKSTVASNFAQLIAHAGQRVILIDSDLRNPSLSHHLAPNAMLGLVDVIAGKADLSDAVWTDPATGLLFLPAGATDKLLHTNRIMASDTMRNFISRQRDIFDFVILDFPPLAPVVDTRATTSFVDSYIYVVEWGGTKRELAETVLGGAPEVYDRLLGVLLNKVNMAQMSRYEGHASPFKYRKHYARYGYAD